MAKLYESDNDGVDAKELGSNTEELSPADAAAPTPNCRWSRRAGKPRSRNAMDRRPRPDSLADADATIVPPSKDGVAGKVVPSGPTHHA